MLVRLRVENLLLIERAELELAPGLNVLTGETGAGKTVLAHALDLLLGGRPRAGIVRPGAAEAYVEGTFAPSAAVLEELRREDGVVAADGEEVVLARRVGADGRTRAYLDGRAAAVADLRRVGERLVAFYGQHEHRRLTLAAAQLEILDGFCGPAQAARRAACAAAHREVRELGEELGRVRALEEARERELDLLEHELAAIDAAAPREGELERLRVERERLRRLDALLAVAGAAAAALGGGAGAEETWGSAEDWSSPHASRPAGGGDTAALAADAAARLDGLAGVDPALDALAARARALAIEAGDLAGELRGYGERLAEEAAGAGAGLEAGAGYAADGVEGGESYAGGAGHEGGAGAGRYEGSAGGGLQALEERMAVLERLLRRHGPTVAEVLAHAERARVRRAELVGATAALEDLTAHMDTAHAALAACVAELRAARVQDAPRLAAAVREQLGALALPDATFAVELSPREPGPTGGDAVELVIAPNPGVAAGPLRAIASGGELARVMLALQTVAHTGSEAALVFDEVDAGIGGHTARTVGERLRDLAAARQVVCITHLPQVASLAARHFSIVKEVADGVTRARVETLGEPEVLAELVRMLGAPERDVAARRHARELRRAA